MDRHSGEIIKPSGLRILTSADLREAYYQPFDEPTFIQTNINFAEGINQIQENSKSVLYCHSNEEKKNLTVGSSGVPIQKVLEEFYQAYGQKVDFVIACNPHKVKIRNCGAYIEGSPTTLLSNTNGELLLNVLSVSGTDSYKIVKL